MMLRSLAPDALALALVLAAGAAQAATTRTWPGAAPCDSTLQACVEAAQSGDTVQIATDAPIAESISLTLAQQSFTLEPAPGFHPLFAGSAGISVTSQTGSNSIAIEGLTLESGGIRAAQNSAAPLAVAIRGNTIASDETFVPITLAGGGTGAVTFDVSDNNLTVAASSNEYLAGISVGVPNASGRIADNTIAMENKTVSGGIPISAIDVSGNTSLSIDVIGNRISGTGYRSGVQISGAAAARILDNLVTGASATDGAAISAYASNGALQLTIANDTLADNATGIVIKQSDSGATLSGVVANNVLTGSSQSGLVFDPAGNVSDHNNLYFHNTSDLGSSEMPISPGPNSVLADPRYVDASRANYHLNLGSPAIDAGDDGAAPTPDLLGSPIPDLDGNPRTQGHHVDIGALESAEPSPAGAPRAFTGELQFEIGASLLYPMLRGSGTAVLNTSIVPPTFVLPAGVFVANPALLSSFRTSQPITPTSVVAGNSFARQIVSVTGHNGTGSFDSHLRAMPFSGLLRLRRLGRLALFQPVIGTATAAIDASHLGAAGKAMGSFTYRTGRVGSTDTQFGFVSLTGQSFAVSKDSRTPAGGGHIQLVAPVSFYSTLASWSGTTSLALDFAPEPERLAMGAVAIAVLVGVGLTRRRAPRAQDSVRTTP